MKLLLLIVCLCLLSPAHAADQVLAVLPFATHTERADLLPLGAGVADMLLTDLVAADGLVVVERSRIDAVLGELALQASDFVDPSAAVEVGKGLGATSVVVGSLTEVGDDFRLDARIVDVASGEVVTSVSKEGAVDDFFEVQRALALRLLAALDGEATLPERTGRSGDGTNPEGPVLRIVRKGMVNGHFFVNGAHIGKPTKKVPVETHLEPGPHELALTWQEDGVELHCISLIDVPEEGLELQSRRACDGVYTGDAPWDSFITGALLEVRRVGDASIRMKLDDKTSFSLSHVGTVLHLQPGLHSFVFEQTFKHDPEIKRRPPPKVICHGSLHFAVGDRKMLMASESDCSGFDD